MSTSNDALAMPPQKNPVPEATDAVGKAVARLAVTRAQLRALTVAPEDKRRASQAGSSPLAAWWKRLVAQQPVLQIMSHQLGHWFTDQAWAQAAQTAGDEARRTLSPWIRRHPVAAVGLASLVGASVAWARPWRWSLVRTAALPAALATVDSLARHLAQAPWADVLSWLMKSAPRSRPANADEPLSPDRHRDAAPRQQGVDKDARTPASPAPRPGVDNARPEPDTDVEVDGALRWFFGGTPPPTPPDANESPRTAAARQAPRRPSNYHPHHPTTKESP